MSDLISRSVLIGVISKMSFDFGNDTDDTETIIEMVNEVINNQPTAYDVEKVVEQLKEWSFEAEIVIPQSDGYDDTTTKEIICTQIATEIVKEGGTE